jgi:hypothetical protein
MFDYAIAATVVSVVFTAAVRGRFFAFSTRAVPMSVADGKMLG